MRKSAKLALVVPGDAPLLRSATLAALIDAHRRGEAAATLLTAELDNPTDYGRVVRDSEGRVQAIVEEKSATPEQRAHSRSEFQHLLLHARKALALL